MDVINMILPIVYIVVGVALIWFVVELILTIRRARGMADEVQKQIEPTLDNVQQLTEDVKPLVERVSLTVDAANLEIMRVDEILQDVNQITGTVTRAVDTVDNVANAPMDRVNSLTRKVRNKLGGKQASDISKEMGQAKADGFDKVEDAMLDGIDADLPDTDRVGSVNKGYTAVKADMETSVPTESGCEVPAHNDATGSTD